MKRYVVSNFSIVLLTIFIGACTTQKRDAIRKLKLDKGSVVIKRKDDKKAGDDTKRDKDKKPEDLSKDKKDDGSLASLESDLVIKNNIDYLQTDENTSELFRVLISSNHYIVSQMKYKKTIGRVEDNIGDEYIIDEMKKYDKFNETREGLIRIWLYPDSGHLMKVRPQKPTNLVEIDKLLMEDIQRWNFDFPKKIIQPTKFDIKYRIILRKTQTDDEIIKEVQKQLREKQ